MRHQNEEQHERTNILNKFALIERILCMFPGLKTVFFETILREHAHFFNFTNKYMSKSLEMLNFDNKCSKTFNCFTETSLLLLAS